MQAAEFRRRNVAFIRYDARPRQQVSALHAHAAPFRL
jgi:hypothetical protein